MRRAWLTPLALASAAIVAAEWMRAPGWILAAGVALGTLLALWGARDAGPGPLARAAAWAGALAALGLSAHVARTTRAITRIEHAWPAAREASVAAASKRLGGELDGAVRQARALADRAAEAATLADEPAFRALEKLIGGRGPACGVVLFDAAGRARAWAGIQRTLLLPAGPDLSAVTTPFYLWLVARRQTPAGTAVSAVLIARADDVPSAGASLTDQFAERTGVGLRFFGPRSAPADSDVFDYVQPGERRDTLFAVQPVPLPQGTARWRVLDDARDDAALLILAVLAAAAVLAARAPLGMAAWVATAALGALARAPLTETFGSGSPFWPDTYYQRFLGPFSSSAGALVVTGMVVFVAGCALWRRGRPPSPLARIVAVLGTLAAPFLLQTLARGITPPASGVTVGLWLTWQVAIVLAASSLVLVAAALVRGREVPEHAGAWPWVASALALGTAFIGLWLWQPGAAWPEWYAYLWVPSLLLTLRPMPFRGTLATIAIVAGSSGALLTWRAATEGRMALAEADIEGLGDQADPLAVALLERLVHETSVDSTPRTAGDLYRLWRRSALGELGYPAGLAVWGPQGREVALDLASLDVPPEVVRRVAAETMEEMLPVVRAVLREPGLHGVAAIPLGASRALTIVIGPPSRLIAPTRQARLVYGAGNEPEPPYEIALAPPGGAAPAPSAPVVWTRTGWTIRGERRIALPGGARHVHAQIDLRDPAALLQRGVLVLGLDVAVLVVLWLLVEIATGRAGPALARWWERSRRSLRLRLSVTLALFFIVPALAFSVWTQGRFEEQFRSARELLLQRTLRDAAAVVSADTAAAGAAPADGAVGRTAERVDAELFLTRGGVLAASSAPVLGDLGLADALVPSDVYRRLVLGDEIELTTWQAAAPAPVLVGYRLLARAGPGGPAILAAPDVAGDRALRRREADLGIALLVGVLAGALAAVVLSGVAARALALPLQRLRGAALAVGSGAPPALTSADVPVELEPIRSALAQAAADVEAGQRAQRVLAWGEMARQVAHEIKNPLTPIRLGVQHLLRVGRERPAEVGEVLPPTGERILAEIDRLDAIARAFSRFALPGAEGVALEPVDLAAVVRDVVHLYRMGEGPPRWESEVAEGARALARPDELVEVLVNLCENARDAGATQVTIRAHAVQGHAVVSVSDDGRGISADVLPHIFEPRFSTTTSGSGLGLAIARRLVESWGGRIAVVPGDAPGTTVRLELRAPPADG
jgi:signal transduction histidine kinase